MKRIYFRRRVSETRNTRTEQYERTSASSLLRTPIQQTDVGTRCLNIRYSLRANEPANKR